jgi:hypothetical protein
MTSHEKKAGASWTAELIVLGLFAILTLTLTYPLVFHMGTTVPSDIGDPLYTIWAMNWEMKQAAHGFGQLFDGNNFFPHKGTLLYADYIPGLTLLAAPFALLTGSLVWAYNILFLASFVLCGWGMYRLVLYLAHDRSAAFIAGLIFAFFNYRFAHLSHLEILFFGWMPLFFLSLFKWIDRPALRSILGAGVYFVLQTWCCAYYGAYLAPFAALGAAYMAIKTKALHRPGFWKSALGLALVTLPFLVAFYLPFVLVHGRMFFSRGMDEVLRYSAQLQFFTSITRGTLFRVFFMPSQESSEWILYPGIVAVLLAVAGGAVYLIRYGREIRAERKSAFAAVDALLFLLLLAGMQIHKLQEKPGELHWGVFPVVLAGLVVVRIVWAWWKRRTEQVNPTTAAGAAVGAPGLAWGSFSAVPASGLEPQAGAPGFDRGSGFAVPAGELKTLAGAGSAAHGCGINPQPSTSSLALRFFLFTGVFAFLLSLGPIARLNDRPLFTGPYLLFYKFLPGFQGMRASGRFAVIMMLAAAVLAGWAVARLTPRIKVRALRFGIVGLIALLVLADYAQRPIPLAQVPLGDRVPPIYESVKALPESAVLIELPMPLLSWIEEDWRNVMPMYYSMKHGKRTANGYGGYYPPGYTVIRDAMEGFPAPRALGLLRDIGVDHVLIHTRAHRAADGQAMIEVLRTVPGEAELLASADGDFLFRLKPAPPAAAPSPAPEAADRTKWKVFTKTNRHWAHLVVDGNSGTGWASKGSQEAGEFILVDLAAPVEVGQVELVQGSDPLGYPRSFVVEGSLDRNAWFELAGVPLGVPDVTAATIGDFWRYTMLIDFPPRTARYVRIRLTAPHRTMHWSIHELHIRR